MSEWVHKRTGAHVRVESSPHYPGIVKVTYLKTGRSTMMRLKNIEKNFRPVRLENPRGGKFDRCLGEVKRRGGVRNPYAIYRAALKKAARHRNPRDVDKMTASALNRALEAIDKRSSKLNQEFIDAGRGHETPREIETKSDPLAVRFKALTDERWKVLSEIRRRYGPDMHSAPTRRIKTIRRNNPRERGFYRVQADVGGRTLHDALYASNLQQAVRVAMSRWRHAGYSPNAAAVRARRQNPRFARSSASVLRKGKPRFTLIAQRPGGKRLVYTGNKFSERGPPKYFPSVATIKMFSKFLKLKYPVLKRYSFYSKEIT